MLACCGEKCGMSSAELEAQRCDFRLAARQVDLWEFCFFFMLSVSFAGKDVGGPLYVHFVVVIAG